MQTTVSSGIDVIQVAEVYIEAGDILQDWDLSSDAVLEVLNVRREKKGTDGTIHYVSLRNVKTNELVEWMWRYAISNQAVVGGPKLEDVRRNPSLYRLNHSRPIWRPDAKENAKAG